MEAGGLLSLNTSDMCLSRMFSALSSSSLAAAANSAELMTAILDDEANEAGTSEP